MSNSFLQIDFNASGAILPYYDIVTVSTPGITLDVPAYDNQSIQNAFEFLIKSPVSFTLQSTDGSTFENGLTSITYGSISLTKFQYLNGEWFRTEANMGGGSGSVTSLTATLPATITPDPTTTTGTIGVTLSVGAGLAGDGSPGSPLVFTGTSDMEHGPDKFRAIGDGNLNIINTVINPDTGLNWTQAEAEAYWYGAVSKFQVDEIVITAAVPGFTYTIDIGGTPYNYIAGGGDTVDDIASALESLIDPTGDGTPQQNATVVANHIRTVLTIPQTITISPSNMGLTSLETIGTRIDVSKDTVDWAAFQHALTLMETNLLNYCVCGNGKIYVTTKDLTLPNWIANGFMAVIDGKGCHLNSGTNEAINLLSRPCPTSGEAVWMGFTNFHIRDFYINGTAQVKQTGLYIEAAHNSLIEMVTVNSCEIGFDARFCLKLNSVNCHSVNCLDTQFRGWNAVYFGADSANAGNNVARWVNCSATTPTGSTYGFHIRGSDSCKVDTCTVEAQPPLYGIYYDNDGSTVCKNFEVTNTHIEFVGACGRSMIGARAGSPSDSSVIVSNMFVQGPGIFMEADADVSLRVILRDIPYVPDQPFLRSINGGYASWHIENCFPAPFVTGGNFVDPDFWQVDGRVDPAYWAIDFGGTVPFTNQIRHIPNPGTAGAVVRFEDVANGLGYLQTVSVSTGLSGDGTPGNPLIATGGTGTVGCIFTQTADQTVTNTTTETTALGTGVGTKTLPANFFVVGKTIRLRVGGVYSTPITGAVATVKIKYGTTVLATVATTALLSNASGLEFDGEALITCRTTGATGTVMTHGDIEYVIGTTGQIAVDSLNNGGATTTINTTSSNALDVTIQWDTAAATKIVKSTVCSIEVLN